MTAVFGPFQAYLVSAYAATTPMEYFAEGTEAFFDGNYFYPFVRAELKEHDPLLHDLLVEIWGVDD
jgi:dipeptidyl-peptidase-4